MKKIWAVIILFMAAFFLACILLLSGCKVERSIGKSKSDSTSVRKSNTASIDTTKAGQVKKQTTKEDSEWWKKTEKYEPPQPGITNVYPSTIIYEGGKGSRQTDLYDSAWIKAALSSIQAKYDSTAAKNEQYRKDSETKSKGLGLFFVVLICAVCLIAGGFLWFYLSKFRIIRS